MSRCCPERRRTSCSRESRRALRRWTSRRSESVCWGSWARIGAPQVLRMLSNETTVVLLMLRRALVKECPLGEARAGPPEHTGSSARRRRSDEVLGRSCSTDGERLASRAGRATPIRTGAREHSREGGGELKRAADEAGRLGVKARALLRVLGFDFRGGAEDLGTRVDHGHDYARGDVQRRGDDGRREAASRVGTAHAQHGSGLIAPLGRRRSAEGPRRRSAEV